MNHLSERICHYLDGVERRLVDDLADVLAGGPLGELGEAMRAPLSLRAPGAAVQRGLLARMSVDRALARLARSDGGADLAAQTLGSDEPLWQMVGQALREIRSAPACRVLCGWAVDCPPGVEECACRPDLPLENRKEPERR